MFYQTFDFIQKLEWPNRFQECRLITTLSKIIGVAIEQYITKIEQSILEDIFPYRYAKGESPTKMTVLSRAQSQLASSRVHTKVVGEPYDFLAKVLPEIFLYT